ncbi:hypothetical protein JX265_009506 [Neoarthrinium moseri]|uniref:Uncharacterized protein n=1 Tax=Neoarthrinium moseri TaxID=1658444 RepID=A0A9Q0AMJ6_9PEZI|nr:hypothetical protein JX265_009506 [Neoarthrinium moseri]
MAISRFPPQNRPGITETPEFTWLTDDNSDDSDSSVDGDVDQTGFAPFSVTPSDESEVEFEDVPIFTTGLGVTVEYATNSATVAESLLPSSSHDSHAFLNTDETYGVTPSTPGSCLVHHQVYISSVNGCETSDEISAREMGCRNTPREGESMDSKATLNGSVYFDADPYVRSSPARLDLFHDQIPRGRRHGLKRRTGAATAGPAKRRRMAHKVHIRATRAFLQLGSECREYVWKRKRGAQSCWRSKQGEHHEEVDGEYLLCFSDRLTIEIRANGDWLPIMVEFYKELDLFEGAQCVDGERRLQVPSSEMLHLMRGIRADCEGTVV